MKLYQKIVEILSAQNDQGYLLYLEKMHNLLKTKNCKECIEDSNKVGHHHRKNSYKISESTFSLLNANIEITD